jgi:acetyl-CoA acetyltransferase family protein
MREAVIVDSVRTGLGKSYRGSFNMTRPDDMGAHCVKALLSRVPKLDPNEIEDLVVGTAQPYGLQGNNLGRVVALLSGLPDSCAGQTVNRFCSSGLQAVATAANEIITSGAEVVIAGGIDNISMIPAMPGEVTRDGNPWLLEHQPGLFMGMLETAENVAKRYNISRLKQDEYSVKSHQRLAAAFDGGLMKDEIVPMKTTMALFDKVTKEKCGEQEVVCDRDEGCRKDTTLEGLQALKTVFDKTPTGSITAGNSCQLTDGASMTLLMSREYADKHGIPYKLIFRSFQFAGCRADEMGVGPTYVIPKLLKRTGLTVDDIGLWEINEAFAVMIVYASEKLGIPYEKMNVNGGAIAMGHPYGVTGSRQTGVLANEMNRRKVRYGVASMCIGGGMGAAALFERA